MSFRVSAFFIECVFRLFHFLIHALLTIQNIQKKNLKVFLQYSKKPFFHNLKIEWYISNLFFLDFFLFPFLTRCLIVLALFCWFLISNLFLMTLARISKCFDSRSGWWYWIPRLENLSFCHLCINKSKTKSKAVKTKIITMCSELSCICMTNFANENHDHNYTDNYLDLIWFIVHFVLTKLVITHILFEFHSFVFE